MFENYVHDGLNREVIHSNSPFIRGFAKLKKMPKIPKQLDRAHPTSPPNLVFLKPITDMDRTLKS